jgi:benzoyl-CoA reductase/2-hydroxyglutaryl-CoA dehydratase subunit BcrC/BadD/HgdB
MNDLFFILYFTPRPECRQYLELVAKEVKFRVDHKIGINPKEKFRLLYTEIPPWFWINMINILHDKGATVTLDSYSTTMSLGSLFDKYYDIQPFYELDPEKPDEAVFLRMCLTANQRSQRHALDGYMKSVEHFNLDGAVFFTNRTCQICTRCLPLRESLFREKTGKPTMNFSGEHCDDRTFSQAQTMAKIDAFIDTLEQQKARLSMV